MNGSAHGLGCDITFVLQQTAYVLRMSSPLEIAIRQLITYNGSLSVAAYWSLCVSHPEHGYYMTRDPFGENGDFTTAPEISQLFGEMVGIWITEQWHAMDKPTSFYLVECGPGRGTLMADIVRIAKVIEFANAMQIHLIEMSPTLQAKQGEALKGHQIVWHEDMATLPNKSLSLSVMNFWTRCRLNNSCSKTANGVNAWWG